MDGKKKAVYRELVFWEMKKLWGMPAMWGFLAVCLFFNVLLVAGSRDGYDYVAFVKEVRESAGSRMGKEFDEKAERIPDSEEKEMLIRETYGAKDLFETYDPEETAELYISRYRMTGWVADSLRKKYEKQSQQIRRLDKMDVSLDVGVAGMTKELFGILFEKLCRAVLTEGMLAAVFAALYICGNERTERTWQNVYASRRGRRVQIEKLLAGMLYALAVYAGIAMVSCAVFAGVWQLGDIWETSMSAQFYYMAAMGMRMPFVTWVPFTVRGYLAAVLLLGAAAVLMFYAFGYLAGLTAKNSYAGFVILFAAMAVNFEAVILAGNSAQWELFETAMWTPVMFWWMQPLWFSDMGINAVVPWQECRTGILCLTAAGVFLYLGFWYFYRKDLK